MMTSINWIGAKVDCYDTNLSTGWFDFYKSFLHNDEGFDIGEFALIASSGNPDKGRIGRLMCVYLSHEKWNKNAKFRGRVRWYTWAKDLDPKLNRCGIAFDLENEVVEDMPSNDTYISLEDIQKKVEVRFGTVKDPANYIKENNLNADTNFLCRYKIESTRLVPYFSEKDLHNNVISNGKLNQSPKALENSHIMTDIIMEDEYLLRKKITESSPITKETLMKRTPSKLTNYKRKSKTTSDVSDTEESDTEKVRSPSNPLKNLKLTPKGNSTKVNGILPSPLQRNSSVKRVLNDSFDSPLMSPNEIQVFSYRIIDQNAVDEKQIKLKLKKSEEQINICLKVFPTKLDDEVVRRSSVKVSDIEEIQNRIEFSPKSKGERSKAVGTPARRNSSRLSNAKTVTPAKIDSTRRRSTRTVERISYAELMSPEANTPKKRVRRTSTISNCSVNLRTPLKEITGTKLLSKIIEDKIVNDDKNVESVTPNKKYNIEDYKSPIASSTQKEKSRSRGRPKKSESESNNDMSPSQKHHASYYGKETEDHDQYQSRSKRSVGPPKKYVAYTISNEKSDDSDCKSEHTKGKGRSKKYISDEANKLTSQIQSDSEDDDSCTLRPKRSVGRPKKYEDAYTDKNDNSTPKISRSKRNVGHPTKYINESNHPNNDSDQELDKNEDDNKKLLRKPRGRPRKCSTTDSDDSTSKPQRTISRPRKYESEDESGDFESEGSSTKIKRNLFSSKKNSTPTPAKSRAKEQDLRRSTFRNAVKEEDEVPSPKTPRTNRKVSMPKTTPKATPSARAKMIREGLITPSVQARKSAVLKDNTPLAKARTQLHVSYIPKALPCREKEFADIISFLEGKLLDGCGGCMYVSGVPGTGKTATVTEVIKALQESVESGDVPSFKYVNINGMRLSEPRQSYVEIVKQLTGKTVSWEQAQTTLENKFVKSRKNSQPIVLVVDELDILCTKRQDVVYNLLDWPTKANAQLIVITIANTMDLPERLLMGRVTSRLGLTRLTFQAYTHKQLQEIVTKRLTGTNAFNPDAIQLVARKVASVSGDARRALDICRRAAEIAELEGKNTLVSMIHVNQALNAMITEPKVQAIKRCSRLEKLILQAVVAEVERTGVEETNFTSVLKMLVSLAALDGFQMVSNTIAMATVNKLGACRLLLTDQKCNTICQKIILNVSADDVYYALTKTDI